MTTDSISKIVGEMMAYVRHCRKLIGHADSRVAKWARRLAQIEAALKVPKGDL